MGTVSVELSLVLKKPNLGTDNITDVFKVVRFLVPFCVDERLSDVPKERSTPFTVTNNNREIGSCQIIYMHVQSISMQAQHPQGTNHVCLQPPAWFF